MSRQYNKVQKRARRLRRIDRLKEKAHAAQKGGKKKAKS